MERPWRRHASSARPELFRYWILHRRCIHTLTLSLSLSFSPPPTFTIGLCPSGTHMLFLSLALYHSSPCRLLFTRTNQCIRCNAQTRVVVTCYYKSPTSVFLRSRETFSRFGVRQWSKKDCFQMIVMRTIPRVEICWRVKGNIHFSTTSSMLNLNYWIIVQVNLKSLKWLDQWKFIFSTRIIKTAGSGWKTDSSTKYCNRYSTLRILYIFAQCAHSAHFFLSLYFLQTHKNLFIRDLKKDNVSRYIKSCWHSVNSLF